MDYNNVLVIKKQSKKDLLLTTLMKLQPRPIREDGLLMNSDYMHRWYLQKKHSQDTTFELEMEIQKWIKIKESSGLSDWWYEDIIRTLG